MPNPSYTTTTIPKLNTILKVHHLPKMLPFNDGDTLHHRTFYVNGPLIVGAGPSGLAVAAGLKNHGVPFLILERSGSIASLWQNWTYNRLKLHLPKKFCQLPYIPFPSYYPEYPSRDQFIQYLQSYTNHFGIEPHFNQYVKSARFDSAWNIWRVRSVSSSGEVVEYICQQLVVATGENAEPFVPEIEGLPDFEGEVIHARDYKSGESFRGRKVLVVGCGNSGMELSLDLCLHQAFPAMVVRSSVNILPREMFGKSSFELAMLLLKWLPVWLVDKILLGLAWIMMGNVEKYGLKLPSIGPLELKNTKGKTPVLDNGALEKIKSGEIQVVPGIKRLFPGLVELVNGEQLKINAVIFATGYRSNVPKWLQVTVQQANITFSTVNTQFFNGIYEQQYDMFSIKGYPKDSFPNGWKGRSGLYAAGFTMRGLSGASADAVKVSEDIARKWKNQLKKKLQERSSIRRCISAF